MFGLPGSGKSTLSRLIAQRLNLAGFTVKEATYVRDHSFSAWRRIADKLYLSLLYMKNEPRRSLFYIRSLGRSRQSSLSDWAASIVNLLYLAELYRRYNHSSSIHLLDQGIAQAVWSVGFAARDQGWIGSADVGGVLSCCPDLVIIVRASRDLILTRLSRRATLASRMERNRIDRNQMLEQNTLHLEYIVDRLRTNGCNVIEIDNDNDSKPDNEIERIIPVILLLYDCMDHC